MLELLDMLEGLLCYKVYSRTRSTLLESLLMFEVESMLEVLDMLEGLLS